MSLEVVSFTINKVKDDNGYIENLGTPEVERVKKEALIARAVQLPRLIMTKSPQLHCKYIRLCCLFYVTYEAVPEVKLTGTAFLRLGLRSGTNIPHHVLLANKFLPICINL